MFNLFKDQFSDVIEWDEFRDDMIFWKWRNNEVKKGSKLIIRPGQDAIFFDQGKIEGIFKEEGEYEVESEIVPFLSTLKGFRFGFNSGMRVEVLFVNTKEFTVKWGTKNVINIPSPSLPGGIPIRANGTFQFRVLDYVKLIDNVAGVKNSYLVEDIRIRISAILDQLLMKWIAREGKDMFNLQANSFEIGEGIKEDLDMQVNRDGFEITRFNIMSFNYPKEIQDMITKSASHGMIGDMQRYKDVSVTDAIASGNSQGGNSATDMAGMMMGMQMAKEMMKDSDEKKDSDSSSKQQPATNNQQTTNNANIPNFCPNCGTKTGGMNFCGNCGHKLT
ncbi:membrane protease subunit (stomatin/prohibitin family) [Gracilibacillus halotolerans]|uniref:Membrane protease subunit (Stomatin/prohibitin family) n=1 Tax=Gracilibacillus halotolerans TaxID=74386 RepID=A0A841RRM1_9BACI|nr:SPFH domain-containing protein [Gracilibacillus halotolerans]MBB6513238.1 membrane protease subunit (stomatin/prohibitin family) [Gracilibacillus halotolerans]